MRLPPFAPVLARPSDDSREIQVGLATPVVLAGLGLDELAFLASLEGGRAVSPRERARFAAVLTRLTLAHAWEEPPERPATVALHGCGAVGVAIATALGAIGARIALFDDAPASCEPLATFEGGFTGTCAGGAARVLSARGIAASVGGDAQIAVLVFTGAPDPALASRLLSGALPHILVACDERGAVVSHVVVPGVTACSRCRAIALTRADPAWPYLALQLAGSQLRARRARLGGLAAPATALRTAVRIAAWLDGGAVGVAERVDFDGTVTTAPISPEPACGCGAAGVVGDEVAAQRARWHN